MSSRQADTHVSIILKDLIHKKCEKFVMYFALRKLEFNLKGNLDEYVT